MSGKRKIKPSSRFELFCCVLLAWFYAEKELLRVVNDNNKKYKEKVLKEKYDEYMQMWKEL